MALLLFQSASSFTTFVDVVSLNKVKHRDVRRTYYDFSPRHPHPRDRHFHRNPKHAPKCLLTILAMADYCACFISASEADSVCEFLAIAATCEEEGLGWCRAGGGYARISGVDVCHCRSNGQGTKGQARPWVSGRQTSRRGCFECYQEGVWTVAVRLKRSTNEGSKEWKDSVANGLAVSTKE